MTSDKCDHRDIYEASANPSANGRSGWFCLHCGQRFVPSDVLEEAREALDEIARDSFLETLVNARNHGAREAWAKARSALRRIEEVLGK